MTAVETYVCEPVDVTAASRVAFPRFQHEVGPQSPVEERRLVERAVGRPWLSPDVVDLHLRATELPGSFNALDYTENMKLTNNWWGNAHVARRRDSRALHLPTIFTPGTDTRLWVTSYKHVLSLIRDVPDQRYTEMVLKGFVGFSDEKHRPCGRLVEFGALLIDEQTRMQKLVLAEQGVWYEPQPDAAQVVCADEVLRALQAVSQHEVDHASKQL